jgi:dUTP pyrophosphatase
MFDEVSEVLSEAKASKKSKTKKKVKVQVLKHPYAKLPEYKTKGSAGLDVYAHLTLPLWIKPGETKLVSTGLQVKIPEGYELQVRSRSGLAANKGIIILNAPGTLDSDFREEVKLILHNVGTQSFEIKKGDRIAQLVLQEVPQLEWEELSESQWQELLSSEENDRKGGFGSTGV